MTAAPTKIRFLYRYPATDPECIGDYLNVSIEVDGIAVQSYGDNYHDKGAYRAVGFVDGLAFAYGRPGLLGGIERVDIVEPPDDDDTGKGDLD